MPKAAGPLTDPTPRSGDWASGETMGHCPGHVLWVGEVAPSYSLLKTPKFSLTPLYLLRHQNQRRINAVCFLLRISALTGVAQLVGPCPTQQKVGGSIPDQGTYLGCGVGPWSGLVREAID